MKEKLVIVYTISNDGLPGWKNSHGLREARIYLDFQVENSIRLGWRSEDIVIVTNFDHLPGSRVEYNNLGTDYFQGHAGGCLSKHIGMSWALRSHNDSVFWLRDHDCWQVARLTTPIRDLLGDMAFLVSGGNPPFSKVWKISDQSCFMSCDWLDHLEKFIEKHKHKPRDFGFGFRLGKWIMNPGIPARVVPYRLAPWRFNLQSDWRKNINSIISAPIVCHHKLAHQDVAEFASGQGHWDFLELYSKFSSALTSQQLSL